MTVNYSPVPDCQFCSESSAYWKEPKYCNEHLPRCQWCGNPDHDPQPCLAEALALLSEYAKRSANIVDPSVASLTWRTRDLLTRSGKARP